MPLSKMPPHTRFIYNTGPLSHASTDTSSEFRRCRNRFFRRYWKCQQAPPSNCFAFFFFSLTFSHQCLFPNTLCALKLSHRQWGLLRGGGKKEEVPCVCVCVTGNTQCAVSSCLGLAENVTRRRDFLHWVRSGSSPSVGCHGGGGAL